MARKLDELKVLNHNGESVTLRDAIGNIPGKDGWSKIHSKHTYYESADKLLELGMNPQDSQDFLSKLYWAATDRYTR